VVAKRPIAMIGSGGSNPPQKRFRGDWIYPVSQYVLHF
jgi:hypothetical protein